MSRRLCILHFNDCYNIESNPTEPVAGAARFKTALQSTSADALVLFSGDILAPSIISTFTLGRHMIPVLNQCKVACAVFGNHDFEFGVQHMTEITRQTSFPWLMSNLLDPRTDRPIADGLLYHVIEKNGMKIGLIGLIEQEWLSTLGTICNPDEQRYLDFVEEGSKYAKLLKKEQHVDLVIALTHMRWPNDSRLAQQVPDIDLILGGHDHDYGVRKVNGTLMIKSGSDFRTFSKIEVVMEEGQGPIFTVEQVDVTSHFPEDQELKQVLNQYTHVMESRMDERLAQFSVDLDIRFAVIRTGENAFGNLAADVMCARTQADVGIINSGTFRSDRVHAAAAGFTFRDLVMILPKVSPVCVILVTGAQLHQALENGVCQFPNLEGRFPQVSGIHFSFDPSKPPLQRIKRELIKIRGEPLQATQEYRLATKSFLADGRDGYSVLKGCPIVRHEEDCAPFPQSITQYFEEQKGQSLCPRVEGRILRESD